MLCSSLSALLIDFIASMSLIESCLKVFLFFVISFNWLFKALLIMYLGLAVQAAQLPVADIQYIAAEEKINCVQDQVFFSELFILNLITTPQLWTYLYLDWIYSSYKCSSLCYYLRLDDCYQSVSREGLSLAWRLEAGENCIPPNSEIQLPTPVRITNELFLTQTEMLGDTC